MNKRAMLGVLVLVAGLLMAGTASADVAGGTGELTVTGEGSVTTVPDTARVTVGTISQDKVAALAMTNTSNMMASFLGRLKELGVPDNKIRTNVLMLDPVYSKPAGSQQAKASGAGFTQDIVAYRATETVVVTVDYDRAGAVLDAAQAAGLNDIRGISFSVASDKRSQLYNDALRQAVKDGDAKARLIGEASGAGPVKLRKITEKSAGTTTAAQYYGGLASAATPAVSPGESKVNAAVTMIYTF